MRPVIEVAVDDVPVPPVGGVQFHPVEKSLLGLAANDGSDTEKS